MDNILKILRSAGSSIVPMKWHEGTFYLLDQRLLPWEERWLQLDTWQDTARAIRDMVVRGAPAIGITAAFGMVLATKEAQRDKGSYKRILEEAEGGLKEARPTAVNLRWAVDRVLARLQASSLEDTYEIALNEALKIWEEDVRANISIGNAGGRLLPQEGGVLTHCNAGALATGGYGTALGVIRGAISQGKRLKVYADETRPWLQGARLTAWELLRDNIPTILNADNAAGTIMKSGLVSAVVVGADRIAANGDVANKIGTYNLAVLAKENHIPFYVAAPSSTLDLECPGGEHIPIEQRGEDEVTHCGGKLVAAQGVEVFNPVFDITPAELVTAIITEEGVLKPPYEVNISKPSP